MDFDLAEQRIRSLKQKLTALREAKSLEIKIQKQAEQTAKNCETALGIVQTVAAAVQEEVHEQISRVVSKCLSTIFPDPYQFKINFERKRGKTEASLKFVRDGLELNPKDSSGGSTIDVAAFALRLACILLSKRKVRRLIVLDEPFRFLEPSNCRKMRDLLVSLAEEFDIQIIQTTNEENLITGNVIDLN